MTEPFRLPAPTGRRSNLRGLLALNLALLVVLAAVTLSGSVNANAQNRGRGDYAMVAGGAKATESSVVYIVDAANQELMIVTYDQTTKALDGLGYRNLAADAQTVTRSRAGN